MSWILILNVWRIAIVVGGAIVLLMGLLALPKLHTLTQYFITTGLLSLVLATATVEIQNLHTPLSFALLANTCGIIFTGVGLVMIWRE
jgi:hypothetical protein